MKKLILIMSVLAFSANGAEIVCGTAKHSDIEQAVTKAVDKLNKKIEKSKSVKNLTITSTINYSDRNAIAACIIRD